MCLSFVMYTGLVVVFKQCGQCVNFDGQIEQLSVSTNYWQMAVLEHFSRYLGGV